MSESVYVERFIIHACEVSEIWQFMRDLHIWEESLSCWLCAMPVYMNVNLFVFTVL